MQLWGAGDDTGEQNPAYTYDVDACVQMAEAAGACAEELITTLMQEQGEIDQKDIDEIDAFIEKHATFCHESDGELDTLYLCYTQAYREANCTSEVGLAFLWMDIEMCQP